MSKGIITRNPGTGTPPPKGNLLVIDPTNTGSSTSLEIGQNVPYSNDTAGNVGDLVNFTLDSSNEGDISSVATSGSVVTSESGSITVSSGQVITVNGTVGGSITVEDGILAIINSSEIGENVESSADGTYILIQDSTIDGHIDTTMANYVTVNNSSIGDYVSTDGSAYTVVRNCSITTDLDILNSSECYSSGNTVGGASTTSPSCGS